MNSFIKRGVFVLLLLLGANLYSQEIQYVNMSTPSKWEQSFDGVTRIKVHWRETSFDTYQERKWVEESIKETWMKYAKIEFYGWGKYDGSKTGIIIDINNYVVPRSLIGNNIFGVETLTDPKENITFRGGMILNFKFLGRFKGYNGYSKEENVKSIAVHEFGHALGIAHEQDRPNCGCPQFPDHKDTVNYGGEYYGTPCDINSVMNYCNPVENNRGVLSRYDIVGIQAAYGKRSVQNIATNRITIINELAQDQKWENLFLKIGNTSLIFNINQVNKKEIKEITISKSGFYQYTVSSITMQTNDVIFNGSGSGQLYFDSKKSYRLKLFVTKNNNNTFKLSLKAIDIDKEKLSFYKQVPKTLTGLKKVPELTSSFNKPTGLLKLYNSPNEKFYIYQDGSIKVFNTQTNTFFVCGKKEASNYQPWNGRNWAWSFTRYLTNNRTEVYTVSTTGEVWSINTDNMFKQFGYVTNSDF